MVEVQMLVLDAQLPLPSYARLGDAGVDLIARDDAQIPPAGGRVAMPTGIALALPAGYAGLVLPRSGLAARHGVTCLNAPGLIDAGFRGELQVILLNTDPVTPYEVRRGDRVAQLLVITCDNVVFRQVTELPASERGEGGLGHSGR